MTGRGPRPGGLRPTFGLIGLAGVLFVAGRTSGAGWVVVLMCALVGLVVVGLVWPALTLWRTRIVMVSAPRDGRVGAPAGLTVLVDRAGPGVVLRLSVAGGTSAPVAPVGAGGVMRITVTPAERGVAAAAAATVECRGPLALAGWTRRVVLDLPAPMAVGPAPVPAVREKRQRSDGRPAVDGGRKAPGRETSRGVRTYQVGDAPRLVHWPATARWGHPMVRELEGEAAPGLHIQVDLRGDPERAERAASVAAGLAGAALAEGRPVILHTAEATGPCSGPVRSPIEAGRRLARAVPDGPPAHAPHPGTVVVSAAHVALPAVAAVGPARGGRETLAERIVRVNARQPPEEDLRVRAAALVTVLAAALGLLAQNVGSPAFRTAVLAGLPAGSAYAWWTRRRPGLVTKVVVGLGAVLALVWFLHTLAGITGGTVADAQTPLAELILWVQVLQGFDATAPRDLRFSVVVSVLVAGVAGILSVSMALLPYLLVWALAGLATLVLAHRSGLRGLTAAGAGPPPEARGAPARQVGTALVGALAGALGLFGVVPPAGTARALTFPAALSSIVPIRVDGGLENPSLGLADPTGRFAAEARPGARVPPGREPFGYFGFSTSLDLADRGRPDDTLVMRVRANRPAMWLGQTFDVWDGRRWTVSDRRSVAIRGALPFDIPRPVEDGAPTATGPDLVQTYYVVLPGPNIVFGVDPATQVYLADGHVDELSDGTLRSSVELGPGAVYTVVSDPPLVTASALRAAGSSGAATPVAIEQRYGRPAPTTRRVSQLAARVTARAPTTYDKVLALEAWIGAHTRYSLHPPALPAGADAVDRFLFVDREGFCEQIATSLVVMLRSLGVPSRLAVGYAGGRRDPFTGLFDVRASDAHAWAEVWFPGVGWEPFDPTADVPLAGDAGGSAASGLGSYLAHAFHSAPVAAVAGTGGAVGVSVLALGGGRWVGARRRRRRGGSPPPSWAAVCQQRLEAAGAEHGRPRRDSETVREYAAALDGVVADPADLALLAELIERSAFSASPSAPDDAHWVEEALARL